MNEYSKELSSADKADLGRTLYEFMKICEEVGLTDEDIKAQKRKKAIDVVKKGRKSK